MAYRKKGGRRQGRFDNTEKGPDRVGYGCPPKETRFKRGQSGNPKGRPKRAPTVHAVLDKVLGGHVELREGERTKRVSKLVALLETAVNRILKGDHRYLSPILRLLLVKGREDQSEVDADDVASEEAFATITNLLESRTHEPTKLSDVSNLGKP
jgi:hypothetical protein